MGALDTTWVRLEDKFLTDSEEVEKIVKHVYDALKEKGYNPVSQLSGYLMTGDPTYITNYKGARGLITRVDRHELMNEIMRFYIENALK
ncbi:MAG: IreB family regulatory phosphoprotein [Clostridia bacterium]|nr:IreB family regulatory phosphoprotein [Clostridia bacterium]